VKVKIYKHLKNKYFILNKYQMDLKTVAAGAAFIIIATHGKVRKRKWWQRKFLKNGISYGDNLMSELLLNDGSSFRNFVRLTKSDFEELLRLVAPKIANNNAKN
jgi:hypothetical protein